MWDDKYIKLKGNWFISCIFTANLEKYDVDAYTVYLHS